MWADQQKNRWTDTRTDGHILIKRCMDASKNVLLASVNVKQLRHSMQAQTSGSSTCQILCSEVASSKCNRDTLRKFRSGTCRHLSVRKESTLLFGLNLISNENHQVVVWSCNQKEVSELRAWISCQLRCQWKTVYLVYPKKNKRDWLMLGCDLIS